MKQRFNSSDIRFPTHRLAKLERLSSARQPLTHGWWQWCEQTADMFQNNTLTKDHLDTLKITFESYWDESSCYLKENVAEEGKWLSLGRKRCHRTKIQSLVAAYWQLSGTVFQRQWTGQNWMSDGRKWRAVTSREEESEHHNRFNTILPVPFVTPPLKLLFTYFGNVTMVKPSGRPFLLMLWRKLAKPSLWNGKCFVWFTCPQME